jgi:hypothetical protein
MNNTIEPNSKWISENGLEVTVVEVLERAPGNVVIFYTEDLTGIKRSFGKNGFLFRFTKR